MAFIIYSSMRDSEDTVPTKRVCLEDDNLRQKLLQTQQISPDNSTDVRDELIAAHTCCKKVVKDKFDPSKRALYMKQKLEEKRKQCSTLRRLVQRMRSRMKKIKEQNKELKRSNEKQKTDLDLMNVSRLIAEKIEKFVNN